MDFILNLMKDEFGRDEDRKVIAEIVKLLVIAQLVVGRLDQLERFFLIVKEHSLKTGATAGFFIAS